MLTRHRQKWQRYKKRKDRKARKELICEFLPLVHYVFSRMSLYLPRILDDQDLIAAGVIGLISAVHDFDISRGIEFTTFAVPRIRGAILDELREHDWVPRTARRRAAQLDAAMEKAKSSAFDPPDMSKVARILGMSGAELGRLMCKSRPAAFVALDTTDDEADANLSVGQLVADRHSTNPEDEAELADQLTALQAALTTLPETERSVIVQYYFQERMQKDIASELSVSRSRVSQIHNHAITALRERLEASGAA